MKVELNNRANIKNNEIKKTPLKKIQVRRSIKDILVNDNPCIHIYNYTGKEINVFPKNVIESKGKNKNNAGLFIDKIEYNIKNDNDEKCIEESSVNCLTNLKRMDSQENKLLNELNELLSKKNLTDEMKNNIKSLFIEIQEIYLEVKTDLENNYPSAQDILKIYNTNEDSDEDKNKDKDYTWRSLCFYKLLNDQLSDIHISTITSYRLEYLKTIYKWYTKNKKIIFKGKKQNKTIHEMCITKCSKNCTVECKREHIEKEEEKEDEMNVLNSIDTEKKGDMNNKMTKENCECEKMECPTKILNNEMNKIRENNLSNLELNVLKVDESNDVLENYIFPNEILKKNQVKENKKKESCIDREEEGKSGQNEISPKCQTNTINDEIESQKTDSFLTNGTFYYLNLNNIIIEENHFSNKPKDIDKIIELEEEIKKQKLLIKNKETEITNSLIGIKFKDIFGKFEDLDSGR
ncbi:conserved Plasmodium protein, unknown function [Plasmodium berghei]|uniref:Uncharacterized protein n=2 Tax=Plasmodium berghei TaxID=5821 RepID=A0A509AF15_PLABA|nr:conserved Plasmodium protein, unknown function [Plasmodium berghei ANKA]CXH96381.1 conserved Plasmodium protein, unknown function [Plasmodium berghei]SCL91138.1 conserved Plasmodium protein, unknown function [Plasmodium berghei]SCM15433.1 conserved Plasmodium protein, unknown function [Plasmodium berghei]SCM17229.1 conserved Plasmodium protein, unknown function [Plasmodium berghei]SCN22322.1 conserved Plasmodium protein, unknown function [Plasmodium berghei]|eukprot:XP_034420019.1 conserved Plasmodium protein, unknown function [Plasmodium berghei ANKA]